MEGRGPIHALLELESTEGSMRGALTPDGGSTQPFAGWLELSAAIETWRAASHDLPGGASKATSGGEMDDNREQPDDFS